MKIVMKQKEKLNALRKVLSDIYKIPDKEFNYQCKPGTNWSTNAPVEKFNLEKIRQGIS